MPTMKPIEPAHSETPHVLVLLATFNGAVWLDEQLRSIFGQQQVRVSVLASDDGSSDGSVDHVRRYGQGLGAVQLLPGAGRQLGAAGNFLRLVREVPLEGVDFIALSDQDDIWQPDRLTNAAAAMRAQRVDGYSSDAIAFWPDGRRRLLGKAHPQRRFDYLFEPAGPGCTYVLSRALAGALQDELRSGPQRFEGIGYHDWLIYAFARSHGFRWSIDPTPGVLYRQHGHNELGANFGIAAAHRRWGRLTSGWFRQQVLQIASLWPGDHADVTARLRSFTWRDRLWLARRASQMRRRTGDQAALAAMLALGILR